MPMHFSPPAAPSRSMSGSRFLSRVPAPALERLRPYLETVHLSRGVLAHTGDPIDRVYFPLAPTLIARQTIVSSGHTVGVGFIGATGVVGAWAALGANVMPCDKVVQTAGDALRIVASRLLAEADVSAEMRSLLVRHAEAGAQQAMQMAACVAFHSTERRCASLLLRLHDLLGGVPLIPFAHERLSDLLGIRRPTVTMMLSELRRNGIIETRRNGVVIRSRADLRRAACECYEQQRMFEMKLRL